LIECIATGKYIQFLNYLPWRLPCSGSTIVFDNLFDFDPLKNDISVYIMNNRYPPTEKDYEANIPSTGDRVEIQAIENEG